MAYSTIDKSSSYMSATLYTGTGASNAITGVGFQPDLVWIKNRTATDAGQIANAASGATKYVIPSETYSQSTNAESVKSFDADGFTVGTQNTLNTNTEEFVSWNWKGGTTSVPSGGSITPSACSFNTTNGFGVYVYAGDTTAGSTIAHGLGVAPSVVMCKQTGSFDDWNVYHKEVGPTKYMKLNSNAAVATATSRWNDTAPSTTLVTLGSDSQTNGTGGMLMYAWADVKGYQKAGVYQGNGNTDGTFVYTGFKPSSILIKRTNSASGWMMFDNKRLGYNPNNKYLVADTSAADGVGTYFQIYSNGFKPQTTDGEWNGSGDTYVYLAVGQSIVASNGVVATAY